MTAVIRQQLPFPLPQSSTRTPREQRELWAAAGLGVTLPPCPGSGHSTRVKATHVAAVKQAWAEGRPQVGKYGTFLSTIVILSNSFLLKYPCMWLSLRSLVVQEVEARNSADGSELALAASVLRASISTLLAFRTHGDHVASLQALTEGLHWSTLSGQSAMILNKSQYAVKRLLISFLAMPQFVIQFSTLRQKLLFPQSKETK